MINQREITPELLAHVCTAILKHLPWQALVERSLWFDDIPVERVVDWMMEEEFFLHSYSKLECEHYAQGVINHVYQKNRWYYRNNGQNLFSFHLFDLLITLLQDVLLRNGDHILCSYEEIFAWRILAGCVGEELPLSGRYALLDREDGYEGRGNFGWPYVTPCDNRPLASILERGISDHHFHLWGSTPYFYVSWVNLMNRVDNPHYAEKMKSLQGTDEVSLPLRAARIRLYLCDKLRETPRQYTLPKCLQNFQDLYPGNEVELQLHKAPMKHYLECIADYSGQRIDYALDLYNGTETEDNPDYKVLLGERWLYYRVFSDYLQPAGQRKLSNTDYNLFWAYFVMRLKLRAKLVQINNRIGFDNFQKIQSRKHWFLEEMDVQAFLPGLVLREMLENPSFQEVEIRISPHVEQIQWLERLIKKRGIAPEHNRLRQKYYYVFHFIKKQDTQAAEQKTEKQAPYGRYNVLCRQDCLRKDLMRQGIQILRFRESSPLQAEKLLGIDAASQEIGCRPEVFAPVYRLLGNHTVNYGGYGQPVRHLSALRKTYHVGEDFLDVVDGLRAIDEVVRFLEFKNGDRIGHALALGIDVEAWYNLKNGAIALPVQDYLDNLAWMYHALSHFSIPHTEALKSRLEADFEYWFRIVYRNNMDETALGHMMQAGEAYYRNQGGQEKIHYHKHTCHFDIMDYYRAWALRGDDPYCYAEGFFKQPGAKALLYVEERCKVNDIFPTQEDDRYVAEYSLLNYYYQFDYQVRRDGLQRIKVNISTEYVQAVKAIQVEMRYLLARKGIAVEVAPTSNVFIGTFRRYEKHPILMFFNRGLPVTPQEAAECPQLQVSINTDDCGVFYTNLEMEYALLARGVERLTDADGKLRFPKTDIYNWLDHIRVMSNDQSFQERTVYNNAGYNRKEKMKLRVKQGHVLALLTSESN